MYRKLFIISTIIFLALLAFSILGFHSISLHTEGLAGKRIAEFADVAEQVRFDVKHKLDKFIQTEQKRPYTDYQYIYTPDAYNNEGNLQLRSPLAAKMTHGMAYGHFQIQPNGNIISPFYIAGQADQLDDEKKTYISNIKDNVLASLGKRGEGPKHFETQKISLNRAKALNEQIIAKSYGRLTKAKTIQKKQALSKGYKSSQARRNYNVQSWDEETQKPQILNRSRGNVAANIYGNETPTQQTQILQEAPIDALRPQNGNNISSEPMNDRQRTGYARQESLQSSAEKEFLDFDETIKDEQTRPQNDMVQIRIEPFVPIVVSKGAKPDSYFGGQVFLLRHIQIEDRHFLQGFKLNELELLQLVKESAHSLKRTGMEFQLSKTESENAAHAAILDFGFGQIILNLFERDPQWIAGQTAQLKNWYFAIVTIVLVATLLAMASLWQSLHAQVCLARKKDDFISAVSHELRTPLTTIRMYTEMLEKKWITTETKRNEYYATMRQESERLSRLIENVLDFSRIQRGRKTYNFTLGDINTTIEEVVNTMAPCAAQQDFTLQKDFDPSLTAVTFDSDAIMQIVINLIDNAIKYASNAADRNIIVRTRGKNNFVTIEVEDHGPGIPHLQRKKIFDEFYRIGEESKRETTGTGLGLALVKKFAQAHDGLVEIITAKPKGALFRITLPVTP
ncbi:MAG: HAMP domain-containing histidine kinase [Planctomycetes bacterium]|nr:HAMP domain-containing histidine kinase [Planctomycetota bacterium]